MTNRKPWQDLTEDERHEAVEERIANIEGDDWFKELVEEGLALGLVKDTYLVLRGIWTVDEYEVIVDIENNKPETSQTEERVEATREEIEAELGPFECATDADARCVLSTHGGAQFLATLSGPELNVEELVETDALRTCNCCDVNRADERSPAGYCVACERSARAGEPCWHEEVDA